MMFKSVDKKFLVDVHVAETITTDTILGRDFLQTNNCTVEMGTRTNSVLREMDQQSNLAMEIHKDALSLKGYHWTRL